MTHVLNVPTGLGALWKKVSRLFERNDTGKEYDVERAQAVSRFIVASVGMFYILTLIFEGTYSSVLREAFVALFTSYFLAAVLLLRWINRKPGEYLLRRLCSMSLDYSAMTFCMAFGGEGILPVYSLVLWVTVGNGIRFGSRYLIIATGFALVSLGLVTWFNAFWRNNPYVVTTLILTTLLVPAYINYLLKQLHALYDEALEANLAKSRFLAQASHDLRQPIHAISLFIASLRDAGLDREQRQMVDNIDRSLQSVSRLFRSLLDISTLDSGKVTPRPEPTHIGTLIGDVVQQNSQAAEWSGVNFKVVHCDLYVQTDPTLLTTMIQNIITNAIKYAGNGPVLIGCRRRGGLLAVEIHDRGPGIGREHLDRVFEEFYQVRERGDKDVEGVGLGLPIVRRLSRLLGLNVHIRSRKGYGTAVIIEDLQIIPAPKQISGSSRPYVPVSVMEGLRVLLVEDDEDVLVATASLLEKWGCVVQAETTVPECEAHCDVVITDFDLGAKTTGADCIARVRAMNRRKVPAVIMTGHDENRVREELGDQEIPVLAKPVRPTELRSLVIAIAIEMKSG